MGHLTRVAKTVVPAPVRAWIRLLVSGAPMSPPGGVGRRFRLRRLDPVRRNFGAGFGQCVDRYYIESFLQAHAADIRGRVLEVQDARYTRQFGGGRVEASDVLHVKPGNPDATIVADLAEGTGLPSDRFDCIILTQTLPFIYDARAAVQTLRRILKPGGVVLATVPGIAQLSQYDLREWGDCWRFTSFSAYRLFEEAFGRHHVSVHAYGNVLTATAFLHGLISSELTRAELEYRDPDYEVTIAVRAIRSHEDVRVAAVPMTPA